MTWSDADLMSVLEPQLSRLGVPMPRYFGGWINLKLSFKSHFKEEPQGGLQKCIERQGLTFTGRAHSGLVDSVNTAALAMLMVRQGFRFVRTTRSFAPDGEARPGSRKAPKTEQAGGAGCIELFARALRAGRRRGGRSSPGRASPRSPPTERCGSLWEGGCRAEVGSKCLRQGCEPSTGLHQSH